MGSQGPHRIHKVNMLKTMEILTFRLQDLKINCFGHFFDASRARPRHPRVSTHILGGVSGPQNASRDSPRPSQDTPRTARGPPGVPLRISMSLSLQQQTTIVCFYIYFPVFLSIFNCNSSFANWPLPAFKNISHRF